MVGSQMLVGGIFLVIVGALWFLVAVICHSRGMEAPLDRFQQLWEPLFTPAIGLLMAAAVGSVTYVLSGSRYAPGIAVAAITD